MKEIPLTQGKFALVDDSDFEYLNQFKWNAHKSRNVFYAERRDGKSIVKMHHIIFGKPDKGLFIDHKDQNGLNNQRENLRIATRSQNKVNAGKHTKSSSKYRGVYWDKRWQTWNVIVRKDGKNKRFGSFKNEIEAALKYNSVVENYHGEFAVLNMITVCGN